MLNVFRVSRTGVDGCTQILKILAVSAMVLMNMRHKYMGDGKTVKAPITQIALRELCLHFIGAAVKQNNALAIDGRVNIGMNAKRITTYLIQVANNLHKTDPPCMH